MFRPASLVAALVLLVPERASAQVLVAEEGVEGGAVMGGRASLASRLPLARGRRGVHSPDPEERRRSVARLANAGTPEAIEALLDAMEAGSALGRDPLGRLQVVRALSVHADRPEVRGFLVREMMDAGARRDVTSGLFSLVRETAALALARRGDPDALAALSTAASLRGPVGDAARAAMLAVPPRSLDALLFEDEEDVDEDAEPAEAPEPKPAGAGAKPAEKGAASDSPKIKKKRPRALSGPILSVLGDMGDQRALLSLRSELDRADRPSRAAAALSLAKLGDTSVAATVRPWLKETDPRFVAAAAEVLVVLGDKEAATAVERALTLEPVRPAAVRLAYELAHPALEAPLAKLLPSLELADRTRAVMALGRMGAAKRLVELLTDAALGPAAISALGSCAAPATNELLARELGAADAKKRRAAQRAAVLRGVVLGQRVSGLRESLHKLASATDPSDLEISALGRVALGEVSASEIVAQVGDKQDAKSLALIAGAARGVLARPHAETAAFATLLAKVDPERPTARDIAAGVALLSDEGADQIPFQVLRRLAQSGGALSPLAAHALPRRAGEQERDALLALLASGDPAVRVGVALGLAASAQPAAVSWLARAYQQEDDTLVRRAIVRSLAKRSEVQRLDPLRSARDLDPDAEIRAVAGRALSKQPQRPSRARVLDPKLAAAFAIAPSEGTPSPRALRLVLPNGLGLPVVSAADGSLLLIGLPFGKATLELVPAAEPSQAPAKKP